MNKDSRIFVGGHRGLVGSAIFRRLERADYRGLITRDRTALDLCDAGAVREFFETERPEFVFLAAAHVGGIRANFTYPAEFIRENLLIQTHVIDAAYRSGVKKLLFLGSSCVYPKLAPQPMAEECLLTGPLESTNEWYAIAKIAGIKMCQAYRKQYGFDAISLMPTNLYGPGDNFDLENSHVLPALIRRFHEAKSQGLASVKLWGTGRPMREFLHVGDLADATLFLMTHYAEAEPINVGTGEDLSIQSLAELIAKVIGYDGEIAFDPDQPDGTPRKLLDVSRLHDMGWCAQIPLERGIQETYQWFAENQAASRN